MGTNIQQHEYLNGGADKYKMKLEDQISEMKRTIEDLKQKVTEQREELWKEKHENDKMIREQEMFRRQLSTFHLPHCPVLTSPPCPVHSTQSYSCPGSPRGDDADLFQGDQDMRRYDVAIFDNIVRNMRRQTEGSCEDLFKVRGSSPPQHDVTYTPSPSPTYDDVTSFALLLTDSCQSRLREVQHRADAAPTALTLSSAQCYAGHNEDDLHQLGDAQSLSPSQIFPNI